MTAKVSISIGIIGDPHVVVKSEPSMGSRAQHSFFEVEDNCGAINISQKKQHPWIDLMALCESEVISSNKTIDALLCVGDLGFRGSQDSIRAAWKLLDKAGRKLNAKIVAAATGNHDVHSRSNVAAVQSNPILQLPKSTGIFETLKLLDPSYPMIDLSMGINMSDARNSRAKYFGEGAVLYEFECFRLLILNSCADHGHENYEYERGSISESTLIAIKKDLDSISNSQGKINLLLVHHPPNPDSSHGSGSLDHIHGGDQLLNALQETGQEWFFIHGHKHHGTITYSSGGSGVTVFSAASLGIRIAQQSKGLRNQFYIVNLELDPSEGLRGIVECWDWYENIGWVQAMPQDGGICDGCGFGNRKTVSQLANEIATIASVSNLPLDWSALLNQVPNLRFVMPDEMQKVKKLLDQSHQLVIEKNATGHWHNIARKA